MGIVLSSYTTGTSELVGRHNSKSAFGNYVESSPEEEKPGGFAQSMSAKIGKILVVNGVVKEVYKNKQNEVVIYIKDRKIPVIIHCALTGSDFQIKYPLRLGENISIKGKFTKISDEMYMANCKIMKREPR